ncbi:hypothetical protein [Clostridium lundense]|uniref:hypothetical protein n=1 Tax=Clostridium lundense TaxID=319475 RepID=UPI00146F9846|nr:hypothetical protein [Clostridium lundense]
MIEIKRKNNFQEFAKGVIEQIMSNMKIQPIQPYFSFFEIDKKTLPIRHKGIPMITTLKKLPI